MSSVPHLETTNLAEATPAHHIHKDSEPLPGTQGHPTVDYSAEALAHTDNATWKSMERSEDPHPSQHAPGVEQHAPGVEPHYPDVEPYAPGVEPHASGVEPSVQLKSETPVAEPTPTEHPGDSRHPGDSGGPAKKVTMMDKVVGKTQQVIGKALDKPAMHEKGELRETHGKAAT
ncbi:hypothetical protein C8J56DRAFT_951774 [Mycena floridula]|nr:hypothetical protein C8J56DRAFT_951774 [Mycena floridula]